MAAPSMGQIYNQNKLTEMREITPYAWTHPDEEG
jgi:hypothetical protein